MSAQDDVGEFAALLRQFKERTDRSYGSLARRLGMNTSTLHRYCAGDAVPQDFAPVERFAALCGASAEERMELHRRWLLAVAARQRPRGTAAPDAPAQTEPEGTPAQEEPEGTAPEPVRESAAPAPAPDEIPPEPAPEDATPAPAPVRPWYRRRRSTVAAAVASVLLATVGTLSALDTGPDSRASDRPQGAPKPRTTAPATTKSPSPGSPSPTATGPSPATSASATAKPSRPAVDGSSGAPSAQGEPKEGVPLTWTADSHVWSEGCGHDYVIGEPPAQVPPPPAPQDARAWAGAQGAVHGRETMVRISVQGRTSTAVILEALRVRVVGRAAPVEGNAYAMDHGCGGAVTPRSFDVDLDKDRPIARPVDGNDAGTTIPAMRLPYRVSAEDPEVLLVTARTEGCDCRWYLELDWSSQGRTGTLRIDDRGSPLRTTGIKGLPRYGYDTSAREWGPYNP
ncbi:helix-turn-helix transcriptional regulator [Streptomyces sp. YS415]|uniref:helix-turn-helix domain-containing protein n=1 Tax=Streptomyces sp. YS415 TaxID=2944806 RepID=UPI002020C428|nr:transcriptional regulator [Streptomyces sp. YS415]MCL7430205.1 helix-turn-helix domain-containing protein [Streptomyces sp. YS415]